MIDVIVNAEGAVVVVHDERQLDGCLEAVISRATGEMALNGDFGSRRIGVLQPSMLEGLDPRKPGLCVRMSRWSLARSEGIKVRLED